ncbi:MAG: Gfo/Idh/MocA family oxidoreductase [Candidatus Heimdallarchaeota archaeon]|nr:Gfo/Idh/MocA family oxidoreductase [Candidatus Heimdallarchaeota archaeon]
MILSAIVIGAGDRGNIYASYAHKKPDSIQIIGVVEPNERRRSLFANKYQLNSEFIFDTYYNLFKLDKLSDILIITTPDNEHLEPALMGMEKGYHLLLEKPMANREEEINNIVDLAKKASCYIQIAHVLRYTDYYSTIKKIIEQDTIGTIVNISMQENVSYYHYAHSYVRGNWHNREQSSPMILAKCSHDLDLLYWYLGKPKMISSVGGLHFLTHKNSEILPSRCTDGCPEQDSCLYYAPRIYEDIIPLLHISTNSSNLLERIVAKSVLKYPKLKVLFPFNLVNQYFGWPISTITEDPSLDARRKSLETGPYGRCVYKIKDHNTVDHQIVLLEFENHSTASLTMHGHSSEEGRYIRIEGTRGTIEGHFKLSHEFLELTDSLTNSKKVLIDTYPDDGHGGGDMRFMENFVQGVKAYISGNDENGLTNIEESYISHIMAFAADKARIQNITIDLQDMI